MNTAELRTEFESKGYTSWINSDLYPDGKIYTKEYTEWLESKLQQQQSELDRLREAIEKRIGELYEADGIFCKERWDMSLPYELRVLAREGSNQVTFARQELQTLLKALSTPPQSGGEISHYISQTGAFVSVSDYNHLSDNQKSQCKSISKQQSK